MKHFKTILVLFNNPQREKFQTEWADNAVAAASQAERHNPGYFCKEVELIKD